jgi:hypothetical protein
MEGSVDTSGNGEKVGKGCTKVNVVQILCRHVGKWKNETCSNYSRIGGRGRLRRMMEGVNSSMIYLIYCKNLCRFYIVPPPNTTIRK